MKNTQFAVVMILLTILLRYHVPEESRQVMEIAIGAWIVVGGINFIGEIINKYGNKKDNDNEEDCY